MPDFKLFLLLLPQTRKGQESRGIFQGVWPIDHRSRMGRPGPHARPPSHVPPVQRQVLLGQVGCLRSQVVAQDDRVCRNLLILAKTRLLLNQVTGVVF